MNFNLHRFNVKIKISVKFYFYSLPVLYVLYVLAIDTTVTTSALNPQQPKCLNPKKKEKKKNCVKWWKRAQYRKDFSSELKHIRGHANISVLRFFEEEEDREEQDQHTKHSLLFLIFFYITF